MPGLTFAFVYVRGILEVRPADDANHYQLVYEIADSEGLEVDSLKERDVSGGTLYANGRQVDVLFWRSIEEDETSRLELESALADWASEHGYTLRYPPDLRV